MAQQISVTLNASVPGGPSVSVNQKVDVDGFDLVRLTIPPNSANYAVDVQPGVASRVQLLVLQLTANADYARGVKYSPTTGAADADRIKLDNVHALVGPGAVALLPEAPNKLYFWTPAAPAVQVEVLVGRRAGGP